MATKKSKTKIEQETPMDAFPVRMTHAMARHYRKLGAGNLSEGVRALGDDSMRGFAERRRGPPDRRKK